MNLENNNNQPLAEVFGFPIENQSERATRYRVNKLCPFNNIVSSCTKNSIEFPLGVCSLNHKNKPVIICPVRFREDWTIISDAAAFIFEGKAVWTHVGEVKLKKVVYTQFAIALEQIAKFEAGSTNSVYD